MQSPVPNVWLLPVGMVMHYPAFGPIAPGMDGPSLRQQPLQVHTPKPSERNWSDTGSIATSTSTDDKDVAFAQQVALALASVRSEEGSGQRKEDRSEGASVNAGRRCMAGNNDLPGDCPTGTGRKPIYGKNFCAGCGNPRNIKHKFC